MLSSSRPPCAHARSRNSHVSLLRRRQFKPRLEILEERLVPVTVTTLDDGDVTAPAVGTLRAAIMLANLNPDHDTIDFSVSGVIKPLVSLPPITSPVTIDGGNHIELNGSMAPPFGPFGSGPYGLVINADGCTVRNLAVTQFRDSGIIIVNGSGNTVENNQVTLNGSFRSRSDQGTVGLGILELPGGSADGNAVRNNTITGNLFGLGIGGGAGNNTISGNTISSSTWDGVFMFSDADVPQATLTSGNDLSGNTISGNSGFGISVYGGVNRTINLGVTSNTIRNNTISSNGDGGVLIDGIKATNHGVFSNTISNNTGPGVRLSGGASGNTIGGVGTAKNLIDHSSGAGVMLQNLGFDFFPGFPDYRALGDPLNNTILGNSIHSNGGLPIDLNNDSITFNDPNDSDSGPNHLQNFPLLSSAVTSGSVTAVTGTLSTTPSGGLYTIDFYSELSGIPGQTYLGSTSAAADSVGMIRFSFGLPAVPAGQFVIATARDASGNTSEFAPQLIVTAAAPTTTSTLPNAVTGANVTVATTSGSLAGVAAVANPAPPSEPPPAGFSFPAGFVSFAVVGLAPGAATVVDLTLPAGMTMTDYFKFGPEASNPTPHWYSFLFNGVTGAETNAQNPAIPVGVVRLHFVDGLRGDDDLAANGTIVDPGAPAVATNTTMTVTSTVSSAVYGQSVTYTAVVSALDPAAGTPTGSVQFYADGSALGSPVTLTNGSASISTATLPAGEHQVTAVYTSDQPAFLGGVPLSPFTQTITPAPLIVTANHSMRAYGAADPAFTASYAGFVLGEDPSVLGGTLTFGTPATVGSDVGTYALTPGGLTSANYSITFVSGTLAVTPAALTITANDATKVTGQDNPPFTVSYAGFVLGQDSSVLSGTLSFATLADAGSPPGAYAITPSGLTAANYTITFVSGTLTVTNVGVQPDPLDPSKRILVIGGSAGDDVICILPGDTPDTIRVVIRERDYHVTIRDTAALPLERIVVYALAGDDIVEVAPCLGLSAWLYGGSGNDRLKGGSGNDVLLGGEGDDVLIGSSGRDLLIGGLGADRLVGNADDDILIAGTTDFDADAGALGSLLGEWARCDVGYWQRIDRLSGGVQLNEETVHDDGAYDQLTGSAGRDWFFANLDGGVRDHVTDDHANEFTDELA